jgi:hypothetical protein
MLLRSRSRRSFSHENDARCVAVLVVSFAAAVVAAALIGAGVHAAPNSSSRLTDNATEAAVDVELVLAVDVSNSMDIDELAAQREGYAEAVVSKEFLSALKSGPHGKVALTYFEWSSANDQKIIIPWRIIDGPETADSVAAEIMKTPVRRGSRTSISGAINFVMQMFAENPYKGLRRVIDVSGDGASNSASRCWSLATRRWPRAWSSTACRS